MNKLKCDSINAKCVFDRTQESNFRCDCNPGFYYNESNRNCVMAQFTTKTKLQFKNLETNERKTLKKSYFSENKSNDKIVDKNLNQKKFFRIDN
jgi:hypothetical protein